MIKYIDKDKVLEYIIFGVVGKEITCGELKRAIESIPTIEVSEDCISREWVKGICEFMLDEEMLEHMLGHIEDAPSVVPSRAEGEWTNAGILTVHCSNCKSQFHELEAMNYCPNCGSRMRGEHNDE